MNLSFNNLNLPEETIRTLLRQVRDRATSCLLREGCENEEDVDALLDQLEAALDTRNYFRPAEKRATMVENLRNIFQKVQLSQQEIHALRGVVATLEGRKTRPRKDRQPPKTAKTSKSRKRSKVSD